MDRGSTHLMLHLESDRLKRNGVNGFKFAVE